MQTKKITLIIGLVIIFTLSGFLMYWVLVGNKKMLESSFTSVIKPFKKAEKEVAVFTSKEEMKEYLKNSSAGLGEFHAPLSVGMRSNESEMLFDSSAGLSADSFDQGFNTPVFLSERSAEKGEPERFSETNVQVLGIDEPDIVKTDGKNIFFSRQSYSFAWGAPAYMRDASNLPDVYPTPRHEQKKNATFIIKAFPFEELSKIGDLEKTGDLLLIRDKRMLVVISDREITGYDVADPAKPSEKWTSKFEDKTALVQARISKGKIYVVVRNYVSKNDPCPIKPLVWREEPITIDCGEIYHPKRIVPVDSAFSIFKLDPEDGKIEKKTTFVGSNENSHVYMSENAVYISYFYTENVYNVLIDALISQGQDLFPASVVNDLRKVKDYEISDEAKAVEVGKIIEDYHKTQSSDDQLRLENEIENRMKNYLHENLRDIQKTGIVKIAADKLDIEATGQVPGRLLNQFSLDEYQGNLRVATSVGDMFGFGFRDAEANVNDVYVLDKKLEILGSVKNLGITERIYSARFLGNRGYLVTFRQIDPFYVLDLSDPKNPSMKGELKIPGYSSYLHPLEDNIILGIGQESGKVKLSLFDVKNASEPKEIDKYLLSEVWSEAQSNHHAFLADSQHKIFFLPGGKGSYVFSHENNKLNLKKSVSDFAVKRAVYINDYLYIIGENKISVLSEKTWEKTKELDL